MVVRTDTATTFSISAAAAYTVQHQSTAAASAVQRLSNQDEFCSNNRLQFDLCVQQLRRPPKTVTFYSLV